MNLINKLDEAGGNQVKDIGLGTIALPFCLAFIIHITKFLLDLI